MSRDHRKLRAFLLADELVAAIYPASNNFPNDERFGLRLQLRRAAVSDPANVVEGSARRTTKEYVNFLNIAAGSASETRYLVDLSVRLRFMSEVDGRPLTTGYTQLCAQLQTLIAALSLEP